MLDSLGNRAYKPNSRLAQVLDILFILHAEHEMNCSTAAARHLASSGVDVYTALSGAVGALYGPLHGGANEAVLKMLSEIGSVENIPEFIEGVKSRAMGFPTEFFPVLFAIPRMAGYLAHWRESMDAQAGFMQGCSKAQVMDQ
ncbi:citrate synthase 3, peroxisomal-like isoform X1 [Rosa rugosa]|uniref:citrate synthase 3, peroxisomal-like isoform X1 n=2 Tax=Rosa rugosa TaxID=74645 RepID=UPI002B411C83|nr:citrate synthase 3, peroxisomal-like isoform X1 [Rosa rugosa]XP_062029688.1 citrate synthase 3, peroxisomal-like isoform X1 [Rosa rugosa]XP_062029689.1 citrate synthase 3, peroxisomal-like isoform X1 [Rosa rugosa]